MQAHQLTEVTCYRGKGGKRDAACKEFRGLLPGIFNFLSMWSPGRRHTELEIQIKKKASNLNCMFEAFQRGLVAVAIKTASSTTNFRKGGFDSDYFGRAMSYHCYFSPVPVRFSFRTVQYGANINPKNSPRQAFYVNQ